MKVLHLPTSVGGNSWGLSQGEKALGLDSDVLIDSNNWLNYKSDICLSLEHKNKFFNVLIRIKTFFKVKNQYDIFHFNFGSSLIDFKRYGINLWDFPFYNGKRIMTYNGSDARQNLNTLLGRYIGEIYEVSPYNNEERNDLLKKRINKITKHVDHIFSLNPDLMYFLPKEKTTFLPYTIAGWENIEVLPYSIQNKIKIVHSPTNREFKGSNYILNALENLQRKYSNIEVEIIEKVPNEIALKKYREADIIVDQVLIGWYGASGVEVMKMGKPLAVFIREEDLKFIPDEMARDLLDTIININKDNIEAILEKYIQNIDLLFKKSYKSIEYVNKWHNPIKIAKIVKKIYEAK